MNKQNFTLLNRKYPHPFILDGALGSLLSDSHFEIDSQMWASLLNIQKPDAIKSIYQQYILAGAQIITTNTFRTNPAALKRANINLDNKSLVNASVNIAKAAAEFSNVIIAGSNAPAEDCYQKEYTLTPSQLEYNHKTHIELLWNSGSHIIWNETQSHWNEIELISSFCSANNFPFTLNLYFTDELLLLSGEPILQAVQMVQSYSPIAIGFNCISPTIFYKLLSEIEMPKDFGFYLNCYGTQNCPVSIEEYMRFVKYSLSYNPLYIGSCCGSNPLYTKAIKELFDEIYRD